MKRKHTLLFGLGIGCLGLLASCENTIPFKTKEIPQKLIVNALFDATAEQHKILLDLTGTQSTTPVENGEIDIYVNDLQKETIREVNRGSNQGRPHEYHSYCHFSAGDRIRLEARTKNGSHEAYAEIIVPEPIEIQQVDTLSILSKRGEESLRTKVTFTDNSQRKDYYRITAEHLLTCYGTSLETGMDTTYTVVIPTPLNINEDIVLTDGQPSGTDENDDYFFSPIKNKYAVFDDSRINGTYTMTVSVPFYTAYYYLPHFEVNKISLSIRINLISLCEASYYYLQALNTYDSDDYDETFNPPIRFPSNIQEGTGIVGIGNKSSWIIRNVRESNIIY